MITGMSRVLKLDIFIDDLFLVHLVYPSIFCSLQNNHMQGNNQIHRCRRYVRICFLRHIFGFHAVSAILHLQHFLFSENFDGSIKKVKCVLSEKMIEDCMFGKTNKLDMLNSAIGKEKYIYVFASKNISEKYKMAYLNVKNLDCIAISDIDVDKIDEE